MTKRQILKDILTKQQITSWFQPVVDLTTMRVSGWGALTRGPSTTPFHSAHALLDGAAQEGLLKPLELLCIVNAATCFEQLLLGGKMFVNTSHEMLLAGYKLREPFKKRIANSALPPNRIVMEVQIKDAIDDISELKSAIDFFHSLGFQIAIDNLGAGLWSEERWPELSVDYVKLDRHIVNGIDTDPEKQQFVRNTIALARASGTRIIAEGVETLSELATIRKAGISLVQGYLIQRPELSPVYPDMGCLAAQLARIKADAPSLACDLIAGREHVDAVATLSELKDLFTANKGLESLAVLDGAAILGLVQRRDLQALNGPADQAIGERVDDHYLSVDSLLPLDQVCQRVTGRARARALDDFIVTHQGKFLGIASVIDLLRELGKAYGSGSH